MDVDGKHLDDKTNDDNGGTLDVDMGEAEGEDLPHTDDRTMLSVEDRMLVDAGNE